MYSLIRAYGVKKASSSLWQDQDISNLKIFEIFQLYRELYLELESPFVTDNVFVNIKDLEEDYVSSQFTLGELFADDPNLALPLTQVIPTYTQKHAHYMDAFRAGYKIEITAPGHSPTSNYSQNNKTELAIRRDATSTKELHENCLVTVNGYLYQTDYDTNYLYVLDGGKSLKKSRKNTCGILSFEQIGKVDKIQITVNDFELVESNIPLSKQVLFKTPIDFRNKTLLLSIGGYLVLPNEKVFKKLSDDNWILNTEKLDLVSRYMESRNYIDYSDLDLTVFPKDKDKVSLIELQSNEVVTKLLTHKQSFFITIDIPNLAFVKQFIRHSPIANHFIAYHNPTSPLFLGRGRQADYWKQQDESLWSITVENGFRPNLTTDSVDSGTHNANPGSNTPYNIYENSRAYLLDIIADIRVT